MFRWFIFLGSALFLIGCDNFPVTYSGTMQVNGVTVPAKATFEEVEYLKDPIIEIKYKISGEKYHTRYFSDFGDKVIYKPESIIVFNDGPDKKQNYYFQGKEKHFLLF